jgi:hypothetical protein
MHAFAHILEAGSNGGIVQLPERKFPGIVIQGDSLSILVSEVESLRLSLGKKDEEEAMASLEFIESHLKERLAFYEGVLAKHSIELPYARREKRG